MYPFINIYFTAAIESSWYHQSFVQFLNEYFLRVKKSFKKGMVFCNTLKNDQLQKAEINATFTKNKVQAVCFVGQLFKDKTKLKKAVKMGYF